MKQADKRAFLRFIIDCIFGFSITLLALTSYNLSKRVAEIRPSDVQIVPTKKYPKDKCPYHAGHIWWTDQPGGIPICEPPPFALNEVVQLLLDHEGLEIHTQIGMKEVHPAVSEPVVEPILVPKKKETK